MDVTREVRAGMSAMLHTGTAGTGLPAVLVDNETGRDVTVTVTPVGEVSRLQARIDQLTAQKADLEAKLSQARSSAAARLVDADRREQRALALLPDCDAHRREIQYLRHCASWYWQSMTTAEEARRAIVGGLLVTAQRLRPEVTFTGAELSAMLGRAVDRQDKPLRRKGYPTLADCLRAGGCDHDGLSDAVKADIAKELGLPS